MSRYNHALPFYYAKVIERDEGRKRSSQHVGHNIKPRRVLVGLERGKIVPDRKRIQPLLLRGFI
ncbi:MAG TPA: hypothetical protein VFE96_01730 [Candidatus Bathyarchaeia archaeon]|nr:hypothetical protein [Candidatus Bathyarchaeia archaeon]